MVKKIDVKDLYRFEEIPDDYEEDDKSEFAYEGVGYICLKIGKNGCPWWGGDGLCLLAISLNVLAEGKATEQEIKNIMRELDKYGDYCPLMRE